LELRMLLGILWRRKLTILSVFSAYVITIMVVSVLISPWYDSTTKVFLRRSWVSGAVMASLGMSNTGSASALTDTDRSDYLALTTVRPIAEKVVSQLNLKRVKTRARILSALPFLKPAMNAIGINLSTAAVPIKADDFIKWPLSAYIFPRPAVKAEQLESTDLITIEGRSTDPKEASDIANAMAKAFVEEELRRIREDFGGAKIFIENNLKKYKNEYRQALQALKQFKEKEKTVNLDYEMSEYIKQISDLKQSQRDLYLLLADTKTKYSPNHPIVIDIQNKIEATKMQIQQKMEKVFGTERMSGDGALRELTEKMTNPVNQTSAGPNEHTSSSKRSDSSDDLTITGLPQKSYEYAQLTLAVSVNQDIYNSLLKALYQVGMSESIAVANIYIAEPAVVYEKGDSDHRHPSLLKNFIISFFVAGFLGIGFAFIVEHLDNTIKTSDDIKSFKGLIFLGSILNLKKKEPRLISMSDYRSPLREQIRTIRNSIKYTALDKTLKSLAITSSMEQEGKSFFASNFAISAAMEGKKVLLIDGDMRRPAIHEYFNLSNDFGLTNYMVGDAEFKDIQLKTDIEGLSIIPTGPIPPDPGKLAESNKMHKLIQEIETMYDLVIVDTPQ
jgi:succinoglycan biosynthesis transport protein ExoP